MEKLHSVKFLPQKMLCLLNKLMTPLHQETPLMQRCEAADHDPRAFDSSLGIPGPNYKMSRRVCSGTLQEKRAGSTKQV